MFYPRNRLDKTVEPKFINLSVTNIFYPRNRLDKTLKTKFINLSLTKHFNGWCYRVYFRIYPKMSTIAHCVDILQHYANK